MEITLKRSLVFGGILLAFGAAARLQPRATAQWRTEQWMESVLPTALPGYSMQPGTDGTSQSYHADKKSYDKLRPYGIVCRLFSKGDELIDTVVVAGNDRDSFHDPYVCFPSQDVQILDSHLTTIQTKSRGAVPVTILKVKDTAGEQIALFCYKGPDGMHPTQNSLYSDWFWNEMRLGKPAEGAFYRFMGVKGGLTEAELEQVAVNYLDAASASSGGVL